MEGNLIMTLIRDVSGDRAKIIKAHNFLYEPLKGATLEINNRLLSIVSKEDRIDEYGNIIRYINFE